MSTIITHDIKTNKPKILINATSCRTTIYNTDVNNTIVDITGEAKKPFIQGVRFINCKIIADDMRAFAECYFDDDCEMIIKNYPRVSIGGHQAQSINKNRVSARTASSS